MNSSVVFNPACPGCGNRIRPSGGLHRPGCPELVGKETLSPEARAHPDFAGSEEIVTELRFYVERIQSGDPGYQRPGSNLLESAADLIDGAEGEITRLRRALTDIAEGYPHDHGDTEGNSDSCIACYAAEVLEAVHV